MQELGQKCSFPWSRCREASVVWCLNPTRDYKEVLAFSSFFLASCQSTTTLTSFRHYFNFREYLTASRLGIKPCIEADLFHYRLPPTLPHLSKWVSATTLRNLRMMLRDRVEVMDKTTLPTLTEATKRPKTPSLTQVRFPHFILHTLYKCPVWRAYRAYTNDFHFARTLAIRFRRIYANPLSTVIDQVASKEGLPAGMDPEVNNVANDVINKF